MTWPYDSDRRQLSVDVSRSVSVFLVWTTVQPRRQFAAAALLLFCLMSSRLQSFIHFWHAPLVVCSAKRRRQSPEWTILTHVNCYIQGEVIGFQVLLDSLRPRSMRASWWSPGERVWCQHTPWRTPDSIGSK